MWLNLTCGPKDLIPFDNWNKFMDMLSYSYEDDHFFEVMLRGVFKLSNSYGNLSQSQMDDKSENRYNDGHSQMSRAQTAQSNSQVNYPYATNNYYTAHQAELERPQSVAYSQKTNTQKSQRKYNPITGAEDIYSQPRHVEPQVDNQREVNQQNVVEVPKNNNADENVARNLDMNQNVGGFDLDRTKLLCKSPESEISQATKDKADIYDSNPGNQPERRGITVSPDPSPPQDFKKKQEPNIQAAPARSLYQLKEYVKKRFYDVEPRGFLALERSFVLLDETKSREVTFNEFATA